MEGIRVTYSGLISFLVGASTIFTGLIFTLIITRQLTQDEFGTWAIIGTLTGYVLLLNPIISYWNTREIARGKETGKTAITSTGFFASIAFFVYLVIAYIYSNGVEIDQTILLFAAILVPLQFFRGTLIGIANGYKPQIEEFGMIVFEILKIVLALVFLYFLDLGLYGLIVVIFFSTIASIVVMIVNLKKKIKGNFSKELLKNWLKRFWIPIYPQIPVAVLSTEMIIFSIFTGGVGGIAYWTAAFTVSRIVRNSRLISKAVYPKVLQDGPKEIFEKNFTHVLFFAFPLAAISLVFAKPGLFALNPIYQVVFPIVLWIVPTIFLRTMTEIFGSVLQGLEKVDIKEDSTFKDYIKSKLVFIPTLKIIHRISYISIFALVLFLLSFQKLEEIELVKYWAIVALTTQIPLTIYVYILLHKEIKPKFETKVILKYFVSTIIVFSIMYFIIENNLEYHESIFIFLPELIGYLIISAIGYFGLTFTIDKKTRNLVKKVLKEIRGNKLNE